jgi:alkylation response protein AidB-like acyl-CoA dehydrogenase
MSQRLRMARIYEGPTEVHRMVVARRAMRQYSTT